MSARLTALVAGPVAGPIISAIGGVRATAWLTWAVVATIALGVQSCRLDNAQDARDTYAGNIKTWQQADRDNRKAIDDLIAANKAWKDAAARDDAKGVEAEKRLQRENERLTQALDAAKTEREKIYARYPQARKWADSGVPAGIADSILRDQVPAANRSR